MKLIPEIANFIGYFIGFINSYILNKKYNFKTDNAIKEELPKFIFTMFSAYAINIIIFFITYRIWEVNVYISQIIAGIFYLLVGFFFSHFYVFNKKR